jgi:tight adherence protein B
MNGAIALVFVVVFAVVVVAFFVFVERPDAKAQRALQRRLRGEGLASEPKAAVEDTLVERRPGDEEAAPPPIARSVLRWLTMERDRAGLDLPPERLLLMSAGIGLAAAVLLGRLSPMPVVAVPLGMAAGYLPIAWVRAKARKRTAMFEEQFPEAIDLMARALRAGHAMTTGLALVAEELPDPVGTEFRLVYDRQSFGMSLPDALKLFADRVPLLDARFFVTAVLTQRESGGNLAEILDNLADVIRQRFKVKRQIRVVTAHARLSGMVLAFMPVVIALGMVVVAPDHIMVLVRDPLGVQMAVAALGLWTLGFLLIRRIVDVEY